MIKKIFIVFCLLFPFISYAQDLYKLKNISFVNCDKLSSSEIEQITFLRSKPLLDRILFWRKSPLFRSEYLQTDIDNLYKAYQSKGYIHVKIKDSLVIDDRKKTVKLFYLFKENEPVRISSFNWIVNASDSIERKNVLNVVSRKKIKLKDKVFDDKTIYDLMRDTKSELMNSGYAFAKIGNTLNLDTVRNLVDIGIIINSRNLCYNGKVEIIGLKNFKEEYLLKKLNLKPNDLFSNDKINKAQTRAFNMQLFRYVTINPIKDSINKGIINYRVILKELNLWDLKISLGYGTDESIRAQANISKKAFLGGLRQMDLGIKTSYYEPFNIYTKFRQPDIFIDNLDFILNPYYRKEHEISYMVERTGSNFTLENKINLKSSIFLTYNLEFTDLKSKEDISSSKEIVEGLKQKSIISLGYQIRDVDNYFNPSNGWYAQALTSYSGLGINKNNSYIKLALDSRFYKSFLKTCVFASRLNIGYLTSAKSGDVTPFEDRFLLGGSNSVRAYARNSIGVVNSGNNTTFGGNSMLEMSIEARFPIYKAFQGAVFCDMGNVWLDSGDYSLSDLKYGLGVGMRYNTPIGPIRLDFASSTLEIKKTQFYLTFGHAF